MAFNFPSNPALNDTYSFGNRTWTWNGSAWQLNTTSAGAINGIPVGNVAPSTGAFTELSVTGNILTDSYRYANGDPFVSSNYSDSNVATYLASFDGNIIPAANVTYDLGSDTNRWRDIYLSGNTINLGGATIKTDAASGAIALIPEPTEANPNPSGMVVSPLGGITVVTTTGGEVSGNAIADAAASPTSAPVLIDITTTVPTDGQALIWDSANSEFVPGNVSKNLDNPIDPQDAATKFYVDTEISNLVNSSPAALDTLSELAAAMGDDPSFAATVTNLIGNNSSNITTLQSDVSAVESSITAIESNVSILQGNITTTESSITALQGNIAAAESDISALQSNVATVDSDITILQGNITTLDGQVANLNYYDNANVTAFLNNIGSNTITTTGNITAGYFVGDGSQLTGIVGAGGATVTLSESAPISPSSGDIWIDTDSGRQYTYINDGDSNQWVELATPATEVGTDRSSQAIFTMPTAITGNLVIDSGVNGLSVGPITQAADTVIHINAGQRWIIL